MIQTMWAKGYRHIIDSQVEISNDETPTRKTNVIDLTLCYGNTAGKISNWKVNEEAYLRTDNKLISFEIDDSQEVEIRERWNFRKADWKKWASSTNKVFEEWISKIEWDLDVT